MTHYYGDDAAEIAKILDIYAYSDQPLGVDAVLMRLRSEGTSIADRAQLVSFIERLVLDHYLTRSADTDRFASPLIQRAWREMRR